ncbi:MAG: hypothetical protein K8R53_04585 [Bacteroidales bacterium]|nr:hypothetical protein [Bacteroidales bacterium]
MWNYFHKVIIPFDDKIQGSLYLDLENPDDLSRLEQPSLYFYQYQGRLICLDEIQRKPEKEVNKIA